ncbi:MAG TPA: hypothetical protein VNU26_17335 [Mycobacteriales bacterium]|nr:hypothetical protein [Mycobacteriales bacterium]
MGREIAAGRSAALDGRRGWTTVVTLATVLVTVVGGQLYVRDAAASTTEPVVAPTAAAVAAAVVAAQAEQVAAEPAPADAAAGAAEQAAADKAAAEPTAAERAAADRAAADKAAADKAAAASLCSGAGWQQRRGAAALASLGSAAQGSGFRVEFAAARSGYLGLAHLDRRVVEVFVRDCGAQSDELLRHVIAHELGHAYDTVRMTEATRAAWQAARGIPASVPWYGCSGCTDFATPAGDFAEVYAQWLRGASSNRSELAGSPGPAQLQSLATQFFGA